MSMPTKKLRAALRLVGLLALFAGLAACARSVTSGPVWTTPGMLLPAASPAKAAMRNCGRLPAIALTRAEMRR